MCFFFVVLFMISTVLVVIVIVVVGNVPKYYLLFYEVDSVILLTLYYSYKKLSLTTLYLSLHSSIRHHIDYGVIVMLLCILSIYDVWCYEVGRRRWYGNGS